jgi:hypothetical protein
MDSATVVLLRPGSCCDDSSLLAWLHGKGNLLGIDRFMHINSKPWKENDSQREILTDDEKCRRRAKMDQKVSSSYQVP